MQTASKSDKNCTYLLLYKLFYGTNLVTSGSILIDLVCHQGWHQMPVVEESNKGETFSLVVFDKSLPGEGGSLRVQMRPYLASKVRHSSPFADQTSHKPKQKNFPPSSHLVHRAIIVKAKLVLPVFSVSKKWINIGSTVDTHSCQDIFSCYYSDSIYHVTSWLAQKQSSHSRMNYLYDFVGFPMSLPEGSCRERTYKYCIGLSYGIVMIRID